MCVQRWRARSRCGGNFSCCVKYNFKHVHAHIKFECAHSNASINLHATCYLDSGNVAAVLHSTTVCRRGWTCCRLMSIQQTFGYWRPCSWLDSARASSSWSTTRISPGTPRSPQTRTSLRCAGEPTASSASAMAHTLETAMAARRPARSTFWKSVALVSPLDLVMVPAELARRASMGLYSCRDRVGTVGRFAWDQWRNRMFLNESVPLNSYKGRAMHPEEAREITRLHGAVCAQSELDVGRPLACAEHLCRPHQPVVIRIAVVDSLRA